MAYIIAPIAKGIRYYGEIKDRFYAEVDQWHFVSHDNFDNKEAFKKALENGGYLVRRVLTEEEFEQLN